MSMAHQSEGGSDPDQRHGHDPTSVSEEEATANPYHLSRGTRTLLRIVAMILAISMTALFLRGAIHS